MTSFCGVAVWLGQVNLYHTYEIYLQVFDVSHMVTFSTNIVSTAHVIPIITYLDHS